MIKVSVIIATYRSGDGLNRVVDSLDAQTLPQNEFETIFIDDGSPDDTYQRLERIAATRPNVVIDRIENSGWPSRPRNIALEKARGEYVLFMDHDDELSPDALRAAYELGHANDADAINPKETRTKRAGWGLSVFTEDMGNAIGRVRPAALMPMTPHKLYRREFLLEHGIRFPEEPRHFWEDVFFNIQVLRHARVISVLSETAFYHWVETDENNSSNYAGDQEKYWRYIEKMFRSIHDELAGDDLRETREALLAHNYRARILNRFSPNLEKRSAESLEYAYERMRAITREFVPEAIDERLSKIDRAKSDLLRADRLDLLQDLARMDRDVLGTARADEIRWEDGRLAVSARVAWRGGAGGHGPDVVMTTDGVMTRAVTPAVREALPASLLDVGAELEEARAALSVRHPRDRSVWLVPSTSAATVSADDAGGVSATVEVHALIDVDGALFGRPMDDGVWTVYSRSELLDHTNQRVLRYKGRPRVALLDGRTAIAYKTPDRHLGIDIGQTIRTVVGSGEPAVTRADVDGDGRFRRFTIPLENVHVSGRTRIEGTVTLVPVGGRIRNSMRSGRLSPLRPLKRLADRRPSARPAVLLGDAEGARVTGEFDSRLRGSYDLVFAFDGRTETSPVRVLLRRGSAAVFERTR